MKLGPVTKQYKRNKITSKKFDEVMSANCNVKLYRQSVKLIFSLTVTFYQKKKCSHQQIKRVLVLKVYFLKLYMYVYSRTKCQKPQKTPPHLKPDH